MRVTIFGAGYVGLVAGACFAKVGHHVALVEADPKKIEMLNNGESIIFEPGLEAYIREGNRTGCLRYTSNAAEACRDAQAIGIAVGTPPKSDGSCDLSFTWNVVETIAENLPPECVVFTKSTVPVGTGQEIIRRIRSKANTRFSYASNPEFLKEGTAINDFMVPERVVLGVTDKYSEDLMTQLYTPFVKKDGRIIVTDVVSAEIAKYACNAMLATRISFMNELARLSDATGGNIESVRKIMGTDSRIGSGFLYSSIGYGGSCFPKDVQAIVKTGQSYGIDLKVARSAHEANDAQIDYFFGKIVDCYEGNVEGKHFAVWGLAFKANTDDVRESQAIKLIHRLLEAGAVVSVFDPEANETAKKELGDRVLYGNSPYDIVHKRDALIIATEWPVFHSPDFERLASELRDGLIVDGRNLFNPASVVNHGLHYVSIGRPDALLKSHVAIMPQQAPRLKIA